MHDNMLEHRKTELGQFLKRYGAKNVYSYVATVDRGVEILQVVALVDSKYSDEYFRQVDKTTTYQAGTNIAAGILNVPLNASNNTILGLNPRPWMYTNVILIPLTFRRDLNMHVLIAQIWPGVLNELKQTDFG